MKGLRKEGSEFWTSVPVLQLSLLKASGSPYSVWLSDGKGVYTWDPQVSAVGFVCAVTFLVANQETAVEAK